jgi:hypothetical protein
MPEKIIVTPEQALKLRELAAFCTDPITNGFDEVRWSVGIVALLGRNLKPGQYEIVVKFRRPRMPQTYGVNGVPVHWHDDRTGELPAAVMHYLAWATGDREDCPQGEAFELLREYMVYHSKAPCWLEVAAGHGPEMAKDIRLLVEKAEGILNLADVGKYLEACLDVGIDPL